MHNCHRFSNGLSPSLNGHLAYLIGKWLKSTRNVTKSGEKIKGHVDIKILGSGKSWYVGMELILNPSFRILEANLEGVEWYQM